MGQRRVRIAGRLVIAVALVALGACGSDSGSASSTSTSSATTTTVASQYGPDDDDQAIYDAVGEVSDYWVREFPTLYAGDYTPIATERLYPYGPSDPPPACGGPGTADYQQVAGNAFYCPPNDYLAWDHAALTPALLQQFGPLTLGVVVAHELGHRTQQLHGILDGRFITFVTEQQADCFAGAWTRSVADHGSVHFAVTDAALDDAVGGFLKLRDPLGTSPTTNPQAHGSAFQRVNAFQDGYTDGPEKCASYETGALQNEFVPESFSSVTDLTTGGNIDYAQLEPLALANLEGFWAAAFTSLGRSWTSPTVDPFDAAQGVSCGDQQYRGADAQGLHLYCAADDTVAWDESTLMPSVYQQVGDMAVATIIAADFAARAQQELGVPDDARVAELQRACLTGVWAGTAQGDQLTDLPANARMQLSPGDLDEVVAAMLQFRVTASPGSSSVVTGFERIDAFRTGFFDAYDQGYASGLSSCLGG